MAFLEFNYIKRGKESKAKAKATLDYIEDKKKENARILFGRNGILSDEEAHTLIETAKPNTYFFRMILSPDVKIENIGKNLDLWLLTEKLVDYLQQQLRRDIVYISAAHNNTDNPHTHTILLIERHGREMLITKERIAEMHVLAAAQALEQQKEREIMRKVPLFRQFQREQHIQPLAGTRGGRAKRVRFCPDCGTEQLQGHTKCHKCGREQGRGLEL